MNGLGALHDGDRAVARHWHEKFAAPGNPQARQNLKGWGK